MLARDRAATLAEIAEAAGVGRSTLHRHFADREELVAAAVEDSLAALGQAVEDAALDQGPPVEAMRRLVAAMAGVGDRLRFLLATPGVLEGREGPAPSDGPVIELIERGQAEGAFGPEVSPRLGRARPLGARLHGGRGGQHRAAAPARRPRHRDPHPRERHPRPGQRAMTTVVTGARRRVR